MTTTYAFKPGDTVTVRGHAGVAFSVQGYEQIYRPYIEHNEEEYYDFDGLPADTAIGEYTDGDNLICIMVGDDRRHIVDPDDCQVLAEEAYCPECGQIGCGHGR